MHEANDHIGLAPSDVAATQWNEVAQREGLASHAVHMDCGSLLDLESGKLSGLPVRHPTMDQRMEFARARSDFAFRYEWEDTCTDIAEIDALMQRARHGIWGMQSRLKWFRDYNIYLNVEGVRLYHFNFNQNTVEPVTIENAERQRPYLEAFLSPQLLYSILTRRVHWNNAEGGLHIDFYRDPDDYVPEAFILMSFLYPVDAAA
jgi:hypothetical protein